MVLSAPVRPVSESFVFILILVAFEWIHVLGYDFDLIIVWFATIVTVLNTYEIQSPRCWSELVFFSKFVGGEVLPTLQVTENIISKRLHGRESLHRESEGDLCPGFELGPTGVQYITSINQRISADFQVLAKKKGEKMISADEPQKSF